MEQFYSIQELVELQSSIQNPNFPKSRQSFEYRAKKENWSFKEVKSPGRNGLTRKYLIPIELALSIQKYLKPELVQKTVHEIAPLKSEALQNAAELSNWQREIAENRLFVVRYIQQQVRLGMKKTPAIQKFIIDAQDGILPDEIQDAVLKANAKAGDERTVSRRTLIDWIQAVEDAEKRKVPVIAVLAPKARRMRIPDWAEELMKLYAQPQKPALAAVLELLPNYLKAGQVCPTYNQAYRFINEKLGSVEAQRGRMGSRDLKNIEPFIRRDTSMMLPTDVYTADGHCFDAEVAHPLHGKAFRPEITAILDVATRRLVGWSVDLAESSFAVLDAIRMAACECGIPAIFYVDNGSGYKNKLMKENGRGVLARLNTEVSHSLPYNSQAKGLIERSHQSIWIRAAKLLPTYIGADMDAQASQKVHKDTRHELKVLGKSKKLISWQDFLLFVGEVVNQYNNRPHSSLKKITDPVTMKKRHQSPLEAWAEALEIGAPIDTVDDWDAEDLFRPYEERAVRRGEIELFGNRYFSTDLTQFHGKRVLVGYDIHCADRLTVRTIDGQFICYAYWNANKRDYFPKSKIEQAREKRAEGRLRRLAMKQDEVLQEVSPRKAIEHMEDQTIIPFNSKKLNQRADLMQELMSLPEVKTETGALFKQKLSFDAPAAHADESVVLFKEPMIFEAETALKSEPESKIQRWISLDEKICCGDDVTEEERKFWKMFPNGKTFRLAKEDDAELSSYLAQRQA